MGPHRSLFCLYLSFQTKLTIFTTNMYEKYPSKKQQCWDSNPQPSEHESPPITTRSGLPLPISLCYNMISKLNNVFRSSQRHVDSCSSEWPTVQADHQEVSPVQRRRTCHRVFLPMSNDWQNDLQGPILFKSF